MSKLAAGNLDLHSGRSQVDPELLTDLARGVGASPALAASIRTAGTGLGALQLCQAQEVPLGDAVALAARDAALVVLRGAPVTVDTICIDRAGVIVGRAEPRG
jgi:cobalt-precorrin-5B (C1)-methyltransferase